ncbi:non-specific lipid-transfer protein-like [Cajanus cajan]|uniref:non-specific lipid-transfer protein-like n=1 Tax=Cajanus cajan TaxID=3821 RepID=UPI00098D942F|nr:non-specific lipid-transfer protein-like [Cajanus cajan]
MQEEKVTMGLLMLLVPVFCLVVTTPGESRYAGAGDCDNPFGTDFLLPCINYLYIRSTLPTPISTSDPCCVGASSVFGRVGVPQRAMVYCICLKLFTPLYHFDPEKLARLPHDCNFTYNYTIDPRKSCFRPIP